MTWGLALGLAVIAAPILLGLWLHRRGPWRPVR